MEKPRGLTATVRLYDQVFLIHEGLEGLVATPISEEIDLITTNTVQAFVTVWEKVKIRGYHPHLALSCAEYLAEELEGEVLDYDKPSSEPTPPGVVF